MRTANHPVKRIFTVIFTFCWLSAAAIIIMLLYLRAQALPASFNAQTSHIYDLHGELIDHFYVGKNRKEVSLEHISPYVKDALLAVEDHRFYKHFGLDLRGIARAIYVNLMHMDKVQGASTITQQVARNLYLNHERTWDRKIREAIYSIQLEMQYSKDEILEKYLNEAYFGHATYGIEAAANLYFDKEAKDLTLAESALLVGVPKGPYYYSPYYDAERAKSRQRIVLNAMVQHGYITQQEADEAFAEELEYMPLEEKNELNAPYFRDFVKQLAKQKLGVDEEQFIAGGYRIFTTLDLRTQNIAEQVIQEHLQDRELQAALIAIDPRNGYIKAMVGGRDYSENQYNRVFAKTRQPGSSFKALVYLAALELETYTPVSKVLSEPTIFTYDDGRQTYAPSNFNQQYPHDYIDMRTAIAKSDNIYAVHTIMDIGPDKVIDLARRLGIQSHMENLPSLALGTFPVSPYELASAFATIANQGERIEPVAIIRIENHRGHVLYEMEPQREQVIDPKYTYVLTHLLESVFDAGGTAARVAPTLKRSVAGKTGTTSWDAWMVGYTPELSTAVWIGYDRDRTISASESYLAAPIFADFTEQTLAPVPPKIFPIPEGVEAVYIDQESGLLATANCPDSRLEVFVTGTAPTEYCLVHESLDVDDELQSPIENQKRSWWEDLKRWWTE